MLEELKEESEITLTENGALTNSTSGSFCLDLFFSAGAMRSADTQEIQKRVQRAFAEDPVKTLKIIFFARDVRGGLGERRFFRTAAKFLAAYSPDDMRRNIPHIPEYGRFDDLVAFYGTPCEDAALEVIKNRLSEDIENYGNNKPISLLAKWLPSVNASSGQTRIYGKKTAKALGMSDKEYRLTLSKLRKYLDIIENRLRESDYTFDYEKQPSRAMFKYRKAFFRNDAERYTAYLEAVNKGEKKLNASALYPYDIIRSCLDKFSIYGRREVESISENERLSLDTSWKNLPAYGENNENAIAVIDGSGSMAGGSPRPLDVALSLGIYFAEHSKGEFANHFITFSMTPRMIEIKGRDIYEKACYCASFDEVANTDLEAVFDLILYTAVKNRVLKSEMPSKLYIISDMEFDYCIEGGNDLTLFETMKKKYLKCGYKLPDIIFWNVQSRNENFPVKMSDTGTALVSGCSPAIFDMVIGGDISPVKIMDDILGSERYSVIE